MKKYKTKGEMIFVYEGKNLESYTRDYKEEYEMFMADKNIYTLFDGKEFILQIESGCIMNYDGSIANIFVDEYDSNLGLFCNNFVDGHFLVNKKVFLDLCENYKIEVNWANK